jgi:preprotein translocase subunit YajC
MLNWLFGISSAMADATQATATAAPAADGGIVGMLGTFLPMILIVGVFYMFLIRPQRKKDKKVKGMLAALKVGDRICTIGGVYGTISSIRDDTITLTVGQQNIPLVFARWAIRNVEEVSVENDSEVLA